MKKTCKEKLKKTAHVFANDTLPKTKYESHIICKKSKTACALIKKYSGRENGLVLMLLQEERYDLIIIIILFKCQLPEIKCIMMHE